MDPEFDRLHDDDDDDDAVIGICGGVGPAAGVMLHQIILHHTDNRGTDQGHLDICHVSRSSDTTDRTSYLLRENRNRKMENPAQGMLRTAHMVQDVVLSCPHSRRRVILGVPCNTFHAPPIWNEFHQELLSSSRGSSDSESPRQVTVLHMLNETVSMIQNLARGCTRVGLLSTTGTRESRVYHDLLQAQNYDVLEVSEELQVELHETIYNPTWGIKGTSPAITPKAVGHFQKYAQLLAKMGAQVIIMGCTEIPFAFVGQDQILDDVLLIDPMVALGRALIREACPSKLKPLLTRVPPVDVKSNHTMIPKTASKKDTDIQDRQTDVRPVSQRTKLKLKPLTLDIHPAQRRLSKLSQRSRPRLDPENTHHRDEDRETSEEPKMWRIWDFYSDYVNSILTPVHDDVY